MERIPDIGRILKNTREDLDLTQLKVMELTGINHKTLSGYENGVSEPDLQSLATLCKLYQLSVDAILKLKPRSDCLLLNRRERELITAYRHLPTEGQESLNHLLHCLSVPEEESCGDLKR